jgi:predicted signal transduction protein with EAL and GGDEF domain
VAERLRAVAGERALAVRLGGDEFALCTASADPAELRALSELVLDRVGGTAGIAGRTLELGLSIGTAAWPGTTERPGDLLRDADLAMYAAKRARRAESATPIVHHETALRVAVEARIAALAELRTALAEDQLRVHYQPLVDLASGETVALEALVRWQHPQRGLLGPVAFVPVAEEGGLIGAIGRFVVETACRDLVALRRTHPSLTMSVNVSALELVEAGFAERILDAVAAHRLEPAALELEITERVLVDARTALPTLELLRDRGVRVAIDDFGTGYSSPLYLRQLPTAALKIDRAFVVDSHGPAGCGILAALLDLARHAGLDAVAEGVETEEQLALLRALGCARAQGYLFSRPLPLAQLRGWLGDALAA